MTFSKIFAALLLVTAIGSDALAVRLTQPSLASLRRYENRLSSKVLAVKGVTGIGIGATRTGNGRLDVMLRRRSAVAKRAVLAVVKDKAPRLSTRFVRFVVTGTFRPE